MVEAKPQRGGEPQSSVRGIVDDLVEFAEGYLGKRQPFALNPEGSTSCRRGRLETSKRSFIPWSYLGPPKTHRRFISDSFPIHCRLFSCE